MIKFLLPSQLVAETPDEPGASPYAKALNTAFRAAYPLVKSAAWRSLPISLFGLLPSIFLLQVYDRVLSRSGTSTLAALVSGILFFLCIEFWLRTRRSRMLRNAGAIIDHGVSGALLQSMLARPLRALEARPASVWQQYFRDVGSVRGTVTGGLAQSIFDLPMAIFALVVIGIVALPVLPVVAAFLAIMSFLAWWWADEVRAGRVEEVQRGRGLDRMTSEICNARETLKTQANDGPISDMWRQTYNAWLTESFSKNGQIETARDGTTVLLTVFSVVVVTVGAISVMEQWMTVGGLVASNMLALKALQPVAGLVSNWRSLATAKEAAKRLETVLGEPVEKPPTGMTLPQPLGRITLKDVSFSFTETAQQPVLENVDLDIGPGGLHVIVGRNGAGKSTLVKLLSGLYDTHARDHQHRRVRPLAVRPRRTLALDQLSLSRGVLVRRLAHRRDAPRRAGPERRADRGGLQALGRARLSSRACPTATARMRRRGRHRRVGGRAAQARAGHELFAQALGAGARRAQQRPGLSERAQPARHAARSSQGAHRGGGHALAAHRLGRLAWSTTSPARAMWKQGTAAEMVPRLFGVKQAAGGRGRFGRRRGGGGLPFDGVKLAADYMTRSDRGP
jgi:energy-coupling factor transporter ATP-binding protein EcfA2